MKPDARRRADPHAPRRKIVVHIATSADGYIARPDGNIDWLTSRPAPKGFYGVPAFERTIDTVLVGRKTFDVSLKLGATFGGRTRTYVFSRRPPPASLPRGVDFVSDAVDQFVKRLRAQDGKDIWMMGGGELIASFLDAGAIDEFIISIVPAFIGEGIPLIAPRHREQLLTLGSVKPFPDGVVQVRYEVKRGIRLQPD
jgi:dihydrofolate reductase